MGQEGEPETASGLRFYLELLWVLNHWQWSKTVHIIKVKMTPQLVENNEEPPYSALKSSRSVRQKGVISRGQPKHSVVKWKEKDLEGNWGPFREYKDGLLNITSISRQNWLSNHLAFGWFVPEKMQVYKTSKEGISGCPLLQVEGIYTTNPGPIL